MTFKRFVSLVLVVGLSSVVRAGDKPVVESISGANDTSGASSFVEGTKWANGLPPGPGTNYVWSGSTLRTPEYNRIPAGETRFAGDRLTMRKGSLAIKTGAAETSPWKPVRIDDLVLAADGIYITQSVGVNTLAIVDGCVTLGEDGSLTTVKDTYLVASYGVNTANNCKYNFLLRNSFVSAQDGQILHVRQYSDQKDYTDTYGYDSLFRIAGDNSQFTGSWHSHNVAAYMRRQGVTLVMESANAIGAVPASPQADAIRLYNNGGLAIAPWLAQPYAPANRGVTIDGDKSTDVAIGRLVTVSNETWGLGMPVAGPGALIKCGAGKVRLQGTYSATGNITVENGTLALADGFASAAFPSVTLNVGTTFEVESLTKGGLAVSNVTLPAGTIVTAFADATGAGTVSLDATCAVTAWPLKVRLSGEPTAGVTYDVLKIAKALKTVTAADIEAISSVGTVYGLPRCDVAVREEGSWQIVSLTRRPVVTISETAHTVKGSYYMNDAATWSDGAVPSPGKDYFTDQSVKNSLRTSSGANSPITFLGGSLTVYGMSVALKNTTVTFSNLVMTVNSGFNCAWGNAAHHLCGKMTVDSSCTDAYPTRLMGTEKQTIWLESDVSGSGTLEFRPYDDSKAATNVTTSVISGDNSAFTGNLRVRSYYVEAIAGTNVGQTLVFTRPEALGGSFPAFRYDAIYLGAGCALQPASSMTLAVTNRGIRIPRLPTASPVPARLIVTNGLVLTLNQTISFDGTLRKEGTGTLALGTPARVYYNGSSQAPNGINNVLDVSEGWIKPLCKRAFADLELTFGAAAGLRLDADASDADVKSYGLFSTYTNAVVLTDSTLPVRIDGATAANGGFSVALCTVLPEVANRIRGKLAVAKPCRGCRLASVTEDSVEVDAKTYTRFTANFERTGGVLIVR